MGSEVELLVFKEGESVAPEELGARVRGRRCLLASAQTLATIMAGEDWAGLQRLVRRQLSSMLVYGVSADELSLKVARSLSGDAVRGVTALDGCEHRLNIAGDERSVCGSFTGLQLSRVQCDQATGMALEGGDGETKALIRVDDLALFARATMGDCEVFILGNGWVPDIDDRFDRLITVRESFYPLIPILMFIKHALSGVVWSNPQPTACFIIDDPRLIPRYGFLDYERLLSEMDAHDFTTTIAFIPWNHQRSSRSISRIFVERPERFSLCIHGCDHTHREFGAVDLVDLGKRTDLARARMQQHQNRTGIPYADVMVFPQGAFSTDSMRVLRSRNYLAAVNSGLVQDSRGVKLRELLGPAVMSYENFALFTRRYPSAGIENFALDLFLGKPCLIVEHHEYFRNGYEAIGDFVDELTGLDANLKWAGLGDVLRSTVRIKRTSSQQSQVQMYASGCVLENSGPGPLRLTVRREAPEIAPPKMVTANGQTIEHSTQNGMLTFALDLDAGMRTEIRVLHDGPLASETWKRPLLYVLRTAARRYLSEMRDCVLSRHPTVLRLAAKIAALPMVRRIGV
jgi:hypothetical protein